MSPIHERDEDIAKANMIAEHARRFLKFDRAVPLKLLYPVDHAMMDKEGKNIECRALVECKGRTFRFGTEGGYYISMLKVIYAREVYALVGVPCLMAIQFSGGDIHICNFDRHERRAVIWGRRDRPNFDAEPCAVYPWEFWQRIL